MHSTSLSSLDKFLYSDIFASVHIHASVITWQEINLKIRDKNNTTANFFLFYNTWSSAVNITTFAVCKALQPQPLKASKLALLRTLRSHLEVYIELGGYFSGFADSKLVVYQVNQLSPARQQQGKYH